MQFRSNASVLALSSFHIIIIIVIIENICAYIYSKTFL